MSRILLCGVLSALSLAVPLSATAHGHIDYSVTVHNHFGETVYFSCDGGTSRELHDDASRTIIVDADDELNVECVAEHDNRVVWKQAVHAHPDSPRVRVVVTREHHHDDNQ
jgi:hypothetical protein